MYKQKQNSALKFALTEKSVLSFTAIIVYKMFPKSEIKNTKKSSVKRSLKQSTFQCYTVLEKLEPRSNNNFNNNDSNNKTYTG